jgi:hypothetical protein
MTKPTRASLAKAAVEPTLHTKRKDESICNLQRWAEMQ